MVTFYQYHVIFIHQITSKYKIKEKHLWDDASQKYQYIDIITERNIYYKIASISARRIPGFTR